MHSYTGQGCDLYLQDGRISEKAQQALPWFNPSSWSLKPMTKLGTALLTLFKTLLWKEGEEEEEKKQRENNEIAGYVKNIKMQTSKLLFVMVSKLCFGIMFHMDFMNLPAAEYEEVVWKGKTDISDSG